MKRAAILGAVAIAVLLGLFLISRPRTISVASQQADQRTNETVPAVSQIPSAHTSTNAPGTIVPGPTRRSFDSQTPVQPSAFNDFANWAERYLAGDVSISPAQGEALAWKRRQAMLELIQ